MQVSWLGDFDIPITPSLIWSILIHCAIIVVVVQLQQVVHHFFNRRKPHYKYLNEFLFSIGWVALTLENTFLFYMHSDVSGVLALGLRLFTSPLIFRRVFGNPCEVVYHYLLRSPRRSGRLLVHALAAEALAIPFGIGVSVLVWRLVGTVNADYAEFYDKQLDYFLSISPIEGFLIEALISFLMFMPGVFLPVSVFCNFIETLFIMGLVYHFGVWTGAFMNPMAAMSCLLMWHYRSMAVKDLGVHFFVFFLGPFIGTLLAVKVARWRFRTHY